MPTASKVQKERQRRAAANQPSSPAKDEAPQYALYTYQVNGLTTDCHVFGPGSEQACQTALDKLISEARGAAQPPIRGMVLPLEPLPSQATMRAKILENSRAKRRV